MHISKKVSDAVKKRAAGRCEATTLKGCQGVGSDLHHRRGAGRRGTSTTGNLLLVCRSCHGKITRMEAGTARYRTHSWGEEGVSEEGISWQPENRRS
jgi:hypothetical protein